jgi:hypothetical protein
LAGPALEVTSLQPSKGRRRSQGQGHGSELDESQSGPWAGLLLRVETGETLTGCPECGNYEGTVFDVVNRAALLKICFWASS